MILNLTSRLMSSSAIFFSSYIFLINSGSFNVSIDSSSLKTFSSSFSHLLQIIERANGFLEMYHILTFLNFLYLPQTTQYIFSS